MKQIPGVENELSLKSPEMKIPSLYDNIDWGARKKLRNRKVSHIERGGSHKIYGSKAIMTKEATNRITFKDHLLAEANDLSALPDQVLGEIRSNITKGAKDLEQKWKNALELVNKAYHVSNVQLPSPDQKMAWKQYETMIAHAVKALSQSRGLDGEWRASNVLVREADGDIGRRRYFVEIPGERAQEVEADSMDDIIDAISNKIRNSRDVRGTKVRIEERTRTYAVLVIYVNDVKRERIIVKEV